MLFSRIFVIYFILLQFAVTISAQEIKSTSLDPALKGKEILESSIKAFGGFDALREIKNISRELTGDGTFGGQGLLPIDPPKERILFESDLFNIRLPEIGLKSVGEDNLDFAEKIERLGLQVETIVPVHGRLGTMEVLQRLLRLQKKRNYNGNFKLFTRVKQHVFVNNLS